VLAAHNRLAEVLLPAIDFALDKGGQKLADLAGVVVGGGPGSFTGLRIAGATAKGLVSALGIPLYSYSGLTVLAAAVGAESRPVCALFDARRDEVYAACYRFPGYRRIEELLGPAPRRLGDVLQEMGRLGGGDVLYAGAGALRHRSAIEAAGGRVVPAQLGVPRASALLWLVETDAAAGLVADAADWEPSYLRGSGAERGISG
jgi:tRNA threonylcarbamoyladenosine biosynthesis protein TsaB